jgi:N-carbamoyl-L-amino-acid hydrolase
MCWFPTYYLGSRALFGLLPHDACDTLRRADTGRTLADHMAEQERDPAPIRNDQRLLDPARLACFIEPHIEQGPVLVDAGLPAGGHRHPRQPALSARRRTAGILATDPATHAPTRIPGLVRFSVDIRSKDAAFFAELDRWLAATTQDITQATGVTFVLGPATHAAPARMDPGLQHAMADAARRADVAAQPIASGGGHDCATFASLGVKSAMLFIRTDHGSHNPHEAIEMADFDAALRILLATLPSLLAV